MKRIWLAAAENGALPRGKVGGVGDVIHELPLALAGIGLQASVITPSYGMFHELPGAELYCEITVRFCSSDGTKLSGWFVPAVAAPAAEERDCCH